MFVNPNQKSVSFGQVLTTLKYLEKEGFTKAQLRKAAPLLFYPTSIIRETLAEMEHLNSEKEADYFLQMCLYFVEREFQFSGDGFFVDYKPQLSEALSKEILRAGGAVTRDETRMEEHQKYGGIPHGGILGETLIASRRNHFDSWNKQSIIRQFSTSCGSRHKLWGISLRNPLEVIKVNSAFLKLRNEWDPSMDQEAFVEATKEVRLVLKIDNSKKTTRMSTCQKMNFKIRTILKLLPSLFYGCSVFLLGCEHRHASPAGWPVSRSEGSDIPERTV